MLKVVDIHKSFGGINALAGVSLEVERGSITGLIGPNGSGKTTLFNVISRFYPQDAGEIYLVGERIDELQPNEVAGKGLCRSFQISHVPEKMTVLENMLLAPKGQRGEGMWNALFDKKRVLQQESHNMEKAQYFLRSVELIDLGNEYAGNLSGGQKKLLALGRILMADPKIILLDEPTAGVNPTLIKSLMRLIEDLRNGGKTFFFVEHNMKVISDICDKVYVLDFGKKIAEGTPREIQHNEEVLEAYLSGSSKKWSRKMGIES